MRPFPVCLGHGRSDAFECGGVWESTGKKIPVATRPRARRAVDKPTGESSGLRFEAYASNLSGLPTLEDSGLFTLQRTVEKSLTAYSDELAPDSNGIPRYVRTMADFL